MATISDNVRVELKFKNVTLKSFKSDLPEIPIIS